MPSPRSVQAHLQLAAETLDALKVSKGCIDCGFNAWPEALHFDHVDPQHKLHSLGWQDDRSKLRSRARLRRFLAHVDRYCVVRCANCHAHRSKVERHWATNRRQSPANTPDDLLLF